MGGLRALKVVLVRSVFALTLILVALLPVQASLVEDELGERCNDVSLGPLQSWGCRYQFQDGGQAGDAPDQCGASDRPVPTGSPRTGLLVPVDDEEDHYTLTLGKGTTTVKLEEPHVPATMPGIGLQLEVRAVDDGACGQSVGEFSSYQSTAYFPGLPTNNQSVVLENIPPGTYDVGVRIVYGVEAAAQPTAWAAPATGGGTDGSVTHVTASASVPFMCQPYCGLSTGVSDCTWGIQVFQPVPSALCYFGVTATFISGVIAQAVACLSTDVPPRPSYTECRHIADAIIEWLTTPDQQDGATFNPQLVHYSLVAETS